MAPCTVLLIIYYLRASFVIPWHGDHALLVFLIRLIEVITISIVVDLSCTIGTTNEILLLYVPIIHQQIRRSRPSP